MSKWLKSNAMLIIAIGGLFFTLASQWTSFSQSVELSSAVDQRLRAHEHDTRRHLDFDRDEKRWEDLIRRLDRIERKLDR